MKNKLLAVVLPACIFFNFPVGFETSSMNTFGNSIDTAHYWTLKSNLDPQSAEIRINPDNYEDNGAIDLPSGKAPCNMGYEELCGIYVSPDPANKSRPFFGKTVNRDIYEALKRNEFLEGKVFLKDL